MAPCASRPRNKCRVVSERLESSPALAVAALVEGAWDAASAEQRHFVPARQRKLPLPGGEGRGEGERNLRPESLPLAKISGPTSLLDSPLSPGLRAVASRRTAANSTEGHQPERLQNNANVADQISACRILSIQFNLLRQAVLDIELFDIRGALEQRFFIPENHGGEVRDPRFAIQNLTLFGCVEFDVAGLLGARSHQAHVAHQHVPKLRQLDQFRLAQQAADPGDARVMVPGQRHTQLVGVNYHRAKFPDAEWSAKVADPDLAVKNRSSVRELHPQGQQDSERRECQQPDRGTHDIEHAFDDAMEHGWCVLRCWASRGG